MEITIGKPQYQLLSVKIDAKISRRGVWVAQLVKCWTSAQVIVSSFMGSIPGLGSVLTAQSLEPASDCVSPLSTPPLFTLCVSLSLSSKFKKLKINK